MILKTLPLFVFVFDINFHINHIIDSQNISVIYVCYGMFVCNDLSTRDIQNGEK